jgi:hypothetical protein
MRSPHRGRWPPGAVTLARFSPFFMRKSVSISARCSCGGLRQRGFGAGLRHQDHELVAAIAEAPVLLAAQFLEPRPVRASSSLPTRWPCASLTSLKRSRSRTPGSPAELVFRSAPAPGRAPRRDGAR